MKNKAIFKFNGGLGALLCSKCSVIIKVGNDFNEDEKLAIKGKKYLKPKYCKNCKTNNNEEQKTNLQAY